MTAIADAGIERRRPQLLGLTAVVGGLSLGAAALHTVAGPPRLPADLPTGDAVLATLRGTDLSLNLVAYGLTTAAWLVWLWLAGSLALRLLLGAGEVLAHGAAWVTTLRALSDRVTLPALRRVADRALVAVVVVNLVGRGPTSVAAADAPATVQTASAARAETRAPTFGGQADGSRPGAPRPEEAGPGEYAEQPGEYTVQPGDTLWALAERFFGSGEAFPRLVAANLGRVMADGDRFTQAGVLRPGWVLLVPPVDPDAGQADEAVYTVAPGDTLGALATRLLGDPARAAELFAINRGTAALPDGRTLTHPDLIWPGLRLRLPAGAAAIDTPPPPDPADPDTDTDHAEPATPAGAPPFPAPTPAAPVAPLITPVPATATAPPIATPPASADPVQAEPTDAQAEPSDGPPTLLVYGAAAAAAAGAAALLVRRVRRSLREPPPAPVPSPHRTWGARRTLGGDGGDDFAEADLARALSHRLHGDEVEPAVLLTEHLLHFLAGQGITDVSPLTVARGRRTTTIILRAGPRARILIDEVAAAFAKRIGARVRTWTTADHDLALQLAGRSSMDLLAAPVDRPAPVAPLLPLGVTAQGETLFANWRELGHVLVAGLPGGGGEVMVTSLTAALTARFSPAELQLWVLARRDRLPAGLLALPHLRAVIDPADAARGPALLGHLRATVSRRTAAGEAAAGWRPGLGEPEHVLLIDECGDLGADGTTLELLGSRGAAAGVRLLVGTTRARDLGADWLSYVTTRLVLQTLDEAESNQLTGVPDAADLGPGEYLLRIDGRAPLWLRGFRVPDAHLADLVRLMQDAYGDGESYGDGGTDGDGEADGNGEANMAEIPAARAVDEALAAGPARDPEIGDVEEGVATDQPGAVGMPGPDIDTGLPLAAALMRPVGSTAGRTEGGDASLPGATQMAEPLDGGRRDRAPEVVPVALPPAGSVGASQSLTQTPGVNGNAAATGYSSTAPSEGGPLLQVRCLGAFVVSSGDREITPTGEEGASYKAWEVLAYLAVQPDGAAPRERLLAAIWPDVDSDRAGNRMRVAMARLRALLARQVAGLTADVVRCERDGTCRLDPASVRSDVQQFAALCQAADRQPEAALAALTSACALYQGDLLTGRGARFYEWVEERDASGLSPRERSREQYLRALQRLAQLYVASGQPARAVPLYKRLLKLEPTLEDIVRDLFQCYGQLGDLGSLVREERHLRQALRDAYYDPSDPEDDPDQYPPEPETAALFARLRAELEASAAVRGHGSRPPAGVRT